MRRLLISLWIISLLGSHFPTYAVERRVNNSELEAVDSEENINNNEADSDIKRSAKENSGIQVEMLKHNEENPLSQQEESLITSSTEQVRSLESQSKDIASGMFGTVSWKIDSEGTLFLSEGTIYSKSPSTNGPPWRNYADQVKKVIIEGNIVTLDFGDEYFFADMTQLNDIIGLAYLDNTNDQGLHTGMFFNVRGMKHIKIPQSIIVGVGAFSGSDFEVIDLREARGVLSQFALSDTKNLKKLILGENIRTSANWGLSNPILTNIYSGKWIHEESDQAYDASELGRIYNGLTMAGTYVWQKQKYLLNMIQSDGGSIFADRDSVYVSDTAQLTATSNPGYQFVRWAVSGAGSSVANATSANTTFTMGTANATVTAEFEAVHELNAKAVPQTLSLGEELSANEASQLVKDVTYNGHALKADEYEVKIEKQANTDEVGNQTAEILVTDKTSNTKVTVTVPVTVQWGNAIRIKGAGSNSRGAFVYNPSKQAILPRWGIYSRDEFVNNAEFGERFYYSIRQLRGTESTFTVDNSQVLKEISANGNSPANIFESQGREWSTAYGDIVEVKHMQASNRLTMMKEEQESSISTRDNQAYIELTKDGYKLLQFDRVETPKVSIVRGMTKGELDKEVGSYVNLSQAPNVEIVGFTNYPDTTKVGESKGTIRVQEKLTTGKYVQKDYEVTFTVEAGLEVKVVPQTLALGGRFLESQVGRFVENVTYNGEKLSEKEYKVTLASQPNSDVNGSTVQATVNIEHVSSKTTKKVEVPVTIGAGHSILFLGERNLGVGFYTWHPELQRLTARRSSPNGPATTQVNGQFNEVYYSLSQYQLTQQQTVLAEKTPNYAYEVQGTQTINSAMENFGKGQQEIEAKVGDVFEIYHRESSSRLKYYLNFGDRMDLSTRDNRAYIELTKDGYEFLQFDRVETPKVSIIRGMTKGELDKEVGSYVKLSQAPNVEVVGFTTYPDTTKVGESKGTIRVQEKLTTGKYVQKDYEVVFIIEPNTLEFERVEDVNFDFGQVKQSSRKQTVNAQGKNAPKITLSDYTEGKSWQLLVSQPEGLKDGKGNKIKGATISLEDIRVIDTVHANVLTANRVELSQSEKVVAQMVNTTGKQEKGKTDIQIGESRDQQLSGVRLTIPRNTVVNEGNYSASIVWELVGDPTV